MNGVDQPDPRADVPRSTRHRCVPVRASTAATKDVPSLSWSTNTLPSWTTGDDAVPKFRYIGWGSNFAVQSGLPSRA
jgi:hypothetical protein